MDTFIKDFTSKIAMKDKKDRYQAIIDILEVNKIDYQIQKINDFYSFGNIIVTFGESNEKKIVVSAHYDNCNGTPGANDNAAACAILLHLILNNINNKKHIEFVFFDLEESGFLGSSEYLIRNKDNILYAINLDMCGLGENIVYSIDNFSQDEMMQIEEISEKYDGKRVKLLPPGDAYNFKMMNKKIIYIINSTNNDLDWFVNFYNRPRSISNCDFAKTMHKENDTVDTINFKQVEIIAKFIFELYNIK